MCDILEILIFLVYNTVMIFYGFLRFTPTKIRQKIIVESE